MSKASIELSNESNESNMEKAATFSLTSDPINPTYAYVGAFVDELQRAGIGNVVICPGSRSTPLAMAFALTAGVRVWMHVDERSAAYFGLGIAKQLGQPVALLCSSGTAAANFLPAIVEAKMTHVPLLVLTADRPHELRENGAPQSIDQNRLYGTYAKWFVDVALPEATNAALRYIRTIAARASALTQAIPAGPVHLNFPFREPLIPEPLPEQPMPQIAQRDLIAWQGRSNNAPYITVRNAAAEPDTGRPQGSPLPYTKFVALQAGGGQGAAARTIEHLAELVQGVRRGLIIVGPIDSPSLVEPLVQFAQQLGYPVLADPLSQLRCGKHDKAMVLSSYDAFLRIDSFIERAQPELVLRFGAMPTSKAVLLYLKRYASCPLVVIDGHEGWEEPTQLASELIHADPVALCQSLLSVLKEREEDRHKAPASTSPRYYLSPGQGAVPTHGTQVGGEAASQEWVSMWRDADRITRQSIHAAIQDFSVLFEGRVFSELAELLPDETTLYTGNSMPVRDLDTFFYGTGRRIHIMGNRGANGIDGVVSSALGASAGAGQDKPTILVLGDLSFYHDLNGLLAARLHGLNLTIVLINNDGGGIFSFLPQAAITCHYLSPGQGADRVQEHFEQLFGVPTGLDFRPAVEMYGGQYYRAEHWEQFRKLVSQAVHSAGLQVIEVQTERASNVTMHRQIWELVGKAINEYIGSTRN